MIEGVVACGRFFLIPFLVIGILFAVLTFITANNRIKEIYEIVEGFSLNITDCYSKTVIHSQEASNIISELLDEKLLVASQAVLLAENNEDNKTLTDLAEKFQIDKIYLYNDKGVILYSNVSKYIGWILIRLKLIGSSLAGLLKIMRKI